MKKRKLPKPYNSRRRPESDRPLSTDVLQRQFGYGNLGTVPGISKEDIELHDVARFAEPQPRRRRITKTRSKRRR